MGNSRSKAVSCNSKTHAKEYFFLRHGYHTWQDSTESAGLEELTPIKVRRCHHVPVRAESRVMFRLDDCRVNVFMAGGEAVQNWNEIEHGHAARGGFVEQSL